MKFRYIFLVLLLLATALVAYHFYAASSAEQMLDESIQETTAKSGMGLNITYSSIDIHPFNGDIRFSDINIIGDEQIQRANSAHFDLAYSDFLNFMFWGTEYGLKQVESGDLQLNRISYTNRLNLMEIKVDSLHVNYNGNLWNLIVLGVTKQPAQIRHHVQATGNIFTFSHPQAGIGQIRADTLQFNTYFGRQPAGSDSSNSTALLSGITWSPPEPFQQKYSFLIRGFGYQTAAIPFEKLSAIYQYQEEALTLYIEKAILVSELFETHLSGSIKLDQESFSGSRINGVTVRLGNMSERFSNFLTNAEKLFGIKIPMSEEGITLQIAGTLEEPEFKLLAQ